MLHLRIPSRRTATAALSALVLSAPVALALPGGASSLTESHGDWTVSCQAVSQDGKEATACVMVQQKINEQRQRAVAIELQSGADTLTGIVVLPFGVAVAAPVTLQVSGDQIGEDFAFSTCLATGCITPVRFAAEEIGQLEEGLELQVGAQGVNGRALALSLSLRGFTSAYARVKELLAAD